LTQSLHNRYEIMFLYSIIDNRRTAASMSLNSTGQQQQLQPQNTFYDDRHYSDIHIDAESRTPTGRRSVVGNPDYYNQIAINHGTSEQTPSDTYQGLDPSVLETLRQPPTPSVYATLGTTEHL